MLAPLGAGGRAGAQNTLSTTGTPTLAVNAAVAGSPPTSVTVSTTTYTFDTNGTSATLQARLTAPLPSGLTLQVSVATPPGVSACGSVVLTTTFQNLTTLIPRNKNGTLTITHRLTATAAAGVVPPQSASIDFRLF
jgi:hypothetical protein